MFFRNSSSEPSPSFSNTKEFLYEKKKAEEKKKLKELKNIYFSDPENAYLKILEEEEKIVKFSVLGRNFISFENTISLIERKEDLLGIIKKSISKEVHGKILRLKEEKSEPKNNFLDEIDSAIRKGKEKELPNISLPKEKITEPILQENQFKYIDIDSIPFKNLRKEKKGIFLKVYKSDILYELPTFKPLFEPEFLFLPGILNKRYKNLPKAPDFTKEFSEMEKRIESALEFYYSHELFSGEFKNLKK